MLVFVVASQLAPLLQSSSNFKLVTENHLSVVLLLLTFCVCVHVNQNGIAGFEVIIPVVTCTGQHFCTQC